MNIHLPKRYNDQPIYVISMTVMQLFVLITEILDLKEGVYVIEQLLAVIINPSM